MEAGITKTDFPHVTISTHAMPAKFAKEVRIVINLVNKFPNLLNSAGENDGGPLLVWIYGTHERKSGSPTSFLHCLHHGQASECVYGQAKAGSYILKHMIPLRKFRDL
jgi:hypothetical protein